jgi:hypothetical protein
MLKAVSPDIGKYAARKVHRSDQPLEGLRGAGVLADWGGASSIHLFDSKIPYVAWMAAPPGPNAVTGYRGMGMPLWSCCKAGQVDVTAGVNTFMTRFGEQLSGAGTSSNQKASQRKSS